MTDPTKPVTQTQPDPNLSTPHEKDEGTDRPTTAQQPAPNLSTEHQAEGDARRPSDSLDKGQADDDRKIGRKTSLL